MKGQPIRRRTVDGVRAFATKAPWHGLALTMILFGLLEPVRAEGCGPRVLYDCGTVGG